MWSVPQLGSSGSYKARLSSRLVRKEAGCASVSERAFLVRGAAHSPHGCRLRTSRGRQQSSPLRSCVCGVYPLWPADRERHTYDGTVARTHSLTLLTARGDGGSRVLGT